MKRTIIGTAGHIDHGKTRLIEALTGIDCDRWAEEKARGITIDLGFAHWRDDDLQVGFIDVPGHERFLHNALAGLGGIRVVLLVVAADEGVKPQTREHLAICRLLEIPDAVVALTKADLVDDDLRELAELEVAELLGDTPWADAPILPVSSVTGDGLETLRETLLARARAGAEEGEGEGATDDEPLRLPVDRAFHRKGLGVVVTGTAIRGRVAVGDTLDVLVADRKPRRAEARVRGIQVHGESRDAAHGGERTALQLVGVELDDMARGSQLVTPGLLDPSRTLCVRMTLLEDAPEAMAGPTAVRVHLYSRDVTGTARPLDGTLEPGGTGLVELRLAAPVATVRGDRFIVRRPSPATTLGGGVVLDAHWRRRRGKPLERARQAIVDDDRAWILWVEETAEAGCTAAQLTRRLGWRAGAVRARLDALAREGRLLRVSAGSDQRFLAPSIPERVVARAGTLLDQFLEADRLARGMPKAQLLSKLLPRRARDMADVFVKILVAEKVLVVEGDLVNRPGRSIELTGEESDLSRAVLAAVEAGGLTPPSPGALAAQLQAKPQILEGVQRYLIGAGRLVLLPTGLIVSTAALESLRDELRATGWDTFGVPEFKERFEISRKWAIPILEYLDSTGTTRRLGDRRQIVAPRVPNEPD